jgi:hypothetical protein
VSTVFNNDLVAYTALLKLKTVFLPQQASGTRFCMHIYEFIQPRHIMFNENALLRAIMQLDSSSLIPNLIPSYLSPTPRIKHTIN